VPVEEHPFILAAKSAERRRPRPIRRAEVTVESAPAVAEAGRPLEAVVRIANTGTSAWQARSDNGIGHVRVGLQLLDAASRMIDRDFARADLPRDVAPGESVQIAIACRAPAAPGEYELKCDLVAEGVTWFEPAGSGVAVRRLRVSG
jgi:hypothetical protein